MWIKHISNNPDAQDCNINVIAKALQTTEQ